MCRMAAHLGDPTSVASLTDEASHSLYRQSYAAREMESATVNADGWGFGWYLSGETEPCVYRATVPIWADANRRSLGRSLASHCVLAGVRSATDPESCSVVNTQPFAFRQLLFMHNGFVERFRDTVRRRAQRALSDEVYAAVRGETDSEHLFALVAQAWLDSPQPDPSSRLLESVRDGVRRMMACCEQVGTRALLTMLVANGDAVVAARAAYRGRPPTLYYSQSTRSSRFASEPLDTGSGWKAVAPGTCVMAPGTTSRLREAQI